MSLLEKVRKVLPLPWLIVWLIGIAPVWYLVPVGPKSGWQIPSDQQPLGFLDNTTLITWPKRPDSRTPVHEFLPPYRYWNVETGELLRTVDLSDQGYDHLTVEGSYILAAKLISEHRTHRVHEIYVLEAETWKPICHFRQNSHPTLFGLWLVGEHSVGFVTDAQRQGLRFHIKDFFSETEQSYSVASSTPLFSKSRKLSASSDATSIVIRTAETGQERFRLVCEPSILGSVHALDFSANDKFLSDNKGGIWDLERRNLLFRIPNFNAGTLLFLPEESVVVGQSHSRDPSRIEFFDIETGKELVERRIELGGHYSKSNFYFAPPDAKYLVLSAFPEEKSPSQIAMLLAKIPGLEFLGNNSRDVHQILIDTRSKKFYAKFAGYIQCWAPDGKHVITAKDGQPNRSYRLWEVPPRRLPWVIGGAFMMWSTCLVALFRFRIRFKQVKC